ncbi:MAG: quinone-dependent dihydroorotate dehydrogenase [Verrucomicrobiota bacterium]
MLYEKLVRPLLFRTDPEWIHGAGMNLLKVELLAKLIGNTVGPQGHPIKLWGLTFRNQLGLAAGFDKNAEIIPATYHLGFGFTEIGTVTPRPQPGNDRPRVYRLPKYGGLINRLGFPNRGADEIAKRLKRLKASHAFHQFPLGINLGKNKTVELEDAAEDYLTAFRLLEPYGDFFVVNVSSPNTPNLRKLQSPGQLKKILEPLILENRHRQNKPLLLKIAPDLAAPDLDKILQTIQDLSLHGIVATNTTIDRVGVDGPESNQSGGLSGTPMRDKSTEMIRHISRVTNGDLPIIGVGGVMRADDYQEKLDAGASLVQTYTGFVYRGPAVVRHLLMKE